jgi:hypothetical protein
MPRDAIAITDLAVGAGTAQPAGTAINVANGGVINNVGDTSRLVIRVTNTAGAGKNVTIKAGVNPPAARKGLGDVVVQVPTVSERLIVVESARHLQADGSIQLDYEAAMAGVASVVRVPKGA